MLLGLHLGLLNDLLALLLSLLIILHILPVCVALEVLRLFKARLVVWNVPFSAHAYNEIFPVFDDNDYKDYKLDGSDSCQGRKCICLILAISFDQVGYILHDEERGEGANEHGH